MRQRIYLSLVLAVITTLSFLFNRYELQNINSGKLLHPHETNCVAAASDSRNGLWQVKDGTRRMEWLKKEQEVKDILARLDQVMPSVTFTDVKTTTSAKNSRATLLNPKDSYCVGDHLMVRLDLYDYLGKRKEYGGDFLRVRIHSPSLQAGASGHIKDYRNGTYLVNFTLFWEGAVRVSLLLIHPSEGVSALWAARKKGFDKIAFTGQFLNGTAAVLTPCGFNISGRAELCEYRDERDQEVFYCVKPKNVPCEAFVFLKSYNRPVSYLTALEKSLFNRSNIGIEIPDKLGDIRVATCNRSSSRREKCSIGLGSPPVPSGYSLQNVWHPEFCSVSDFNTLDKIHACLKRKVIYLMGDSTLRQWIYYLTERVTTLKFFDFHGTGLFKTHVAMDPERNTFIQWMKHEYPFVTYSLYSVKTSHYVTKAIDQVAGDQETALVIGLGQHFRPFPIDLFVRRMVHVRRAVERLLLRSPDTKVFIKLENVREMLADSEVFGDFQGYAQYLATKDIFQGLQVGILDSWDMSVAYNVNSVHPHDHVVWSQIVMFLTYLC
ncbi:NXPE family member 1-like isoform X1 [Tiliqua scincoides]|uniref:NXPE family member 1-like isoform X1 n=1 Tax=Tiliqua scincoides TaxID=71010 RepID=UPI003462F274